MLPPLLIEMNMLDLNLLFVLLFITIFFIQALRKQQFNWLWFAIALWLVLGLFSAQILPRVLGITQMMNLYVAHFYVACGSVFFFLNDVEKLPEKSSTWQSQTAGRLLTLVAVSGLSMHLALAILGGLMWWEYPNGNTPFVLSRLVMMYTLDPMFWYGSQILLMILFALHRWLMGEHSTIFSLQQIYTGVFLCLIWQFLYTMNFYTWLPRLLQWLMFRYS